MELTAPAWSKPDATVAVTLKAVSYIGASVAGSEVSVTWSVGGAQGVMRGKTDASGVATVSLPLPDKAPADAKDGTTLSFNAEWIGPTRERVVRSKTVKLAPAARYVRVARNSDSDVPGVGFGVTVAVGSNEEDGAELPGVPLAVTLAPNATGSADCDTATSCSVVSGSGDWSACQLALPCRGVFKLQACTQEAAATDRVCGSVTIGRNATQWTASPWASHDAAATVRLVPDKTSYRVGDTAQLSFQLPWPGASALLVWGSGPGGHTTQRVASPAVGLNRVALPLGAECKAGCTVALLLSVPRQPASAAVPQLPTSQLFDPRAPHSAVVTTQLNVAADNALDVKVSIAAAASSPSASSSSSASSSTTSTAAATADAALPDVVAPGETAFISVDVTDGSGSPVSDAHVTVIAVDKAWLDLLSYPLQGVASQMVLRLAEYWSSNDMNGVRLTAAAIDAVFGALMRRLGRDPWLPLDTTVSRPPWMPNGKVAVDEDDDAYLGRFTSQVTVVPPSFFFFGGGGGEFFGCGRGMPCAVSESVSRVGDTATAMPVAAPDAAMKDGGGGPVPPNGGGSGGGATTAASSAAASVSPRVAESFLVTPLFRILTTPTAAEAATGGSAAHLNFTAPDSLGTFVVRAYAAARGGGRYGSGEGSIIVRRSISLTASVPRFVRVGDVFEAGVVVTVSGNTAAGSSASVTVALTIAASPADGDAPEPLVTSSGAPTTKTVTLAAPVTQREVRFAFEAAALGDATLQFSASDGSGASDALQLDLSVQRPQDAVFLATSFAVAASNSTTAWQEGLELPAAVPGTGSLAVSAGVGYLPAVQAAFDALPAHRPQWAEAYPALMQATQAPVWRAYGLRLTTEQSDNVSFAIDQLATLSVPTFGLLHTDPNRWADYSYPPPSRCDVGLNTFAAWLAGSAYPALPGTHPLAAKWAALRELAASWRLAAQRQVIVDANQARAVSPPSQYSDLDTLAWLYYVSGASWDPLAACTTTSDLGVCPTEQAAADIAFDRLSRDADRLSLQGRLLHALTLVAAGGRAATSAAVNDTVASVLSNIRVQGRTSYLAADAGGAAAAGTSDQALSLSLLLAKAAARARNPLVQKLAAGVAQGRPAPLWLPYFVHPASPGSALAVKALTSYDVAAGSSTPDVYVELRSG